MPPPSAAQDESPGPDRNLNRYFFIGALIGTTILFFWMVRSFLLPVLLAAVFCTLFYPLYENLLRLLWGKKTLASLACCVILLLLLLGGGTAGQHDKDQDEKTIHYLRALTSG